MGICCHIRAFDHKEFSISDLAMMEKYTSDVPPTLEQRLTLSTVDGNAKFKEIASETFPQHIYIDQNGKHLDIDCYTGYLAFALKIECATNLNLVRTIQLLRMCGSLIYETDRFLTDDSAGVAGYLFPDEVQELKSLLNKFELKNKTSINANDSFLELLDALIEDDLGLYTFLL